MTGPVTDHSNTAAENLVHAGRVVDDAGMAVEEAGRVVQQAGMVVEEAGVVAQAAGTVVQEAAGFAVLDFSGSADF